MRKWISCNTLFGKSKMTSLVPQHAMSQGTSSSTSSINPTPGPLFKNRTEETRTSRLDEQQMMKLKHVSGLMANYSANPGALYAEGLQPGPQHNMRVTSQAAAAQAAQFNSQFGLLGNTLPSFPFQNPSGASLNSAWAAIQAQVENNKGLLAAAAQAAQQAAAQQQAEKNHGLMGHSSPNGPSYPSSLPVTSFGPISGATKSMGQDMFNTIDQPMLKMNLEKNMMHSILLKGQFNSPSRRSPSEKAMIE